MLDGEASIIVGHRIINSYKGPEKLKSQFSRDVDLCQKKWNEELKVGMFDDLIFSKLESALKHGRTSVNILDLGSGSGNLMRSFLTNFDFGKKSREFLSKNKNFHINFIGITDAKSNEEFLITEKINPENNKDVPDNSQITARNIKYTFSYQQNLRKVMEEFDINTLDLCVSTNALMYIGPNVFNMLVKEISELLNVDGEAVLYGFSSKNKFPGFSEGFAVGKPYDLEEPSLKTIIIQKRSRFRKAVSDPNKEQKYIEKAEELMLRLGVITQEQIDERRKAYLHDSQTNIQQALFNRAKNLYHDEQTLLKAKGDKMTETKKIIFRKICNEFGNKLENKASPNTLYLKKIKA